jgi:hypothetical protein
VFFKASTAPTIALIDNGSASGQYTSSVLNDDITSSKLNNSIPSFNYTFSGAYGKTQSARRLTITTGGNVIYDSGYSYTSTTTFDAPDGYIQNNVAYVFTIEAHDTDDLDSNQLSISYTALWAAPAQIENIIVQEIDGSLNLTWDQSVDSTFVRYNVYRRQSSGSAWSLLTTISDKTKKSYFDFSAAVGVTYQYTVTQTALPSGSHEVDSDIAAATVVEARNTSDNWWIVVENNQALAVELYVDTEARTQPYQEETFEPFGRNRKVIVRYAQYGVEGNISSVIPLDETAVKLSILKKIAELTDPVYLKTPFGDVYKVYLGIPNYSYTSGGNVNYSVTYVEVD